MSELVAVGRGGFAHLRLELLLCGLRRKCSLEALLYLGGKTIYVSVVASFCTVVASSPIASK